MTRREHCIAYSRAWHLRRRAERPSEALFSATKLGAAKRNISFALTPQWFARKFAANKCELTGLEFDYGKRSLRLPSPDRIDSSKGYTEDNTRLICWGLNAMKMHHSEEDFIKFLKDAHSGLNEQARTH
jgi:hypothetical protein